MRLWEESAEAVLDAVRLHRASLKRPPKTAAEYLATLEQCRLVETAARLPAARGGNLINSLGMLTSCPEKPPGIEAELRRAVFHLHSSVLTETMKRLV